MELAFELIINKSQGQIIGTLGLYSASPMFSHGQLHVVMSHVIFATTIKELVLKIRG